MSALPIFARPVTLELRLTGRHGLPLYIIHTTTRESIEILKAKAEGIKIYTKPGTIFDFSACMED
jgi:hypothetical protein